MNQSQYDAGRGQTVTQSIFFKASEIMSPYLCHDPVTSCDTPSIRDGPRILKPSQHGAFDPPPIAVIRTPGLFHSLVTKSRLPRHDCIEKMTTYDKSKKNMTTICMLKHSKWEATVAHFQISHFLGLFSTSRAL